MPDFEYYISLGSKLGYPVCCISDFCDRVAFGLRVPKGPWTGTGFVPCKGCAEIINEQGLKKFVAAHIAPHRRVAKDFPNV
jgi:hypothetical protein